MRRIKMRESAREYDIKFISGDLYFTVGSKEVMSFHFENPVEGEFSILDPFEPLREHSSCLYRNINLPEREVIAKFNYNSRSNEIIISYESRGRDVSQVFELYAPFNNGTAKSYDIV